MLRNEFKSQWSLVISNVEFFIFISIKSDSSTNKADSINEKKSIKTTTFRGNAKNKAKIEQERQAEKERERERDIQRQSEREAVVNSNREFRKNTTIILFYIIKSKKKMSKKNPNKTRYIEKKS